MRPLRPTVSELRGCVQKDRHREIGNFLARWFARPTAVYGCWLAIRLGLTAHQVTLAALVTNLLAAAAIGTGTRGLFVAGIILAHLGFWLDHVDGQVARWRGTASLDGVYFDYLMHHLVNLTLGFSLGYGLAVRSGDPRWSLLGFAVAGGWTFLSLHNDCRYKAFIQRLKSASGGYRVDGGGAGRPRPPMPWPRRGLGVLTWPAFKACEPHVILVALSGLATMAVVAPSAWLACWRGGVVVWAILGPLLAAGRITRAIALGQVESEFHRWYQPLETDPVQAAFPPLIHSASPWT